MKVRKFNYFRFITFIIILVAIIIGIVFCIKYSPLVFSINAILNNIKQFIYDFDSDVYGKFIEVKSVNSERGTLNILFHPYGDLNGAVAELSQPEQTV